MYTSKEYREVYTSIEFLGCILLKSVGGAYF